MCTGTNYCKKCNKEINYGDAFKRHVDLDQETFTCLICKKIFIEKKKIVKHLAYHKEVSSSDHCLLCTETAFSCEICSKKFSTKIGWELHLKNHANPEKRRCEVCQKECNYVQEKIMKGMLETIFRCKSKVTASQETTF